MKSWATVTMSILALVASPLAVRAQAPAADTSQQSRDTLTIFIAVARALQARLPEGTTVGIIAEPQFQKFVPSVAQAIDAIGGTIEEVCQTTVYSRFRAPPNCPKRVDATFRLGWVELHGDTGSVHIARGGRIGTDHGFDVVRVLMRRSGSDWTFVSITIEVVG